MSLDRYDPIPPGLSSRPASLLELLRVRAELHPSRRAVIDIDRGGGERATLSYRELYEQALGTARQLELQGWSKRPVLMTTSLATSFAVAFFGVLAAGGAPVPTTIGNGPGSGKKLAKISRDSKAAGLLVDAPLASRAGHMMEGVDGTPLMSILSPRQQHTNSPPEIGPDDIALIQYTSGSTLAPRGVAVRHSNLLHNLSCIQGWIVGDPGSVTVGWLPLYHDMGLIGLLLHPIFSGGTAALMQPADFISQPLRWAHAFTRYEGQQSATPNFGIEILVRAARAKGTEGLDLSSIKGIANGAEPVRASTIAAANEILGPVGLDPDAIVPCYGMAESTLIATAPDRPRTRALRADPDALADGRFEESPQGRTLVSCGHAFPESELLIVDPLSTEVLGDGRVGEVWLRGPSVATGYLHGPGEAFGAVTSDGRGDCLRTGDLGFLHEGEIFLSGRTKDLIVIAGRNVHPTDLEWTAENAHPMITPNSTAAFAVEGEIGEEPVMFVEFKAGTHPDEVLSAIRSAVTREHDCELREIIPLERGHLPRTTSGKARRSTCREFYESGRLTPLSSSPTPGVPQ